MFSQKLDFLMRITGVINSELANACCIDASQVSRLRNGSRKLAKNQNYLFSMVEHLAKRINTPFKANVIADALNIKTKWPTNISTASSLLLNWLITECNEEMSEDTKDFYDLSKKFNEEKIDSTYNKAQTNIAESDNKSTTSYYYGNLGKKQAFSLFLNEVLNERNPQTIYLSCDESIDWLYDDKIFTQEWIPLIKEILNRGNKIIIINTINRSLEEMMQIVSLWLPFYITGSIRAYYFPKLRDTLIQRSLFIAPKTAAITSNSYNHKYEGMLNLYIKDPDAIAALKLEFDNYLSLCKPLMDVIDDVTLDDNVKKLLAFEKTPASSTLLSTFPSLLTMPTSQVSKFNRLIRLFVPMSGNNLLIDNPNITFEEILTIPSKEKLAAEVIYTYKNSSGIDIFSYNKENYIKHLQNIIKFANKHDNYNLRIIDTLDQDLIIYIKEDVGVILANPDISSTILLFRDPAITYIFYEYITPLIKSSKDISKEEQIEKLEEYINSIQ